MCRPYNRSSSQGTPSNTSWFCLLQTIWHCWDRRTDEYNKNICVTERKSCLTWSSLKHKNHRHHTSIAWPNSKSNVTTQMHWIQSDVFSHLSLSVAVVFSSMQSAILAPYSWRERAPTKNNNKKKSNGRGWRQRWRDRPKTLARCDYLRQIKRPLTAAAAAFRRSSEQNGDTVVFSRVHTADAGIVAKRIGPTGKEDGRFTDNEACRWTDKRFLGAGKYVRSRWINDDERICPLIDPSDSGW